MSEGKWLLKGLLLAALISCTSAWAVPSRTTVFRNDKLRLTVFSDRTDKNLFWYVPPMKLYEEGGKVVSYRRPKDGKVTYYFYVVPFMTDEIADLMAGEIRGLSSRTQLQPVTAKNIGIQMKQFNFATLGDPVTQIEYLNQPQLIKVALDDKDAEEFDFFLQNKPGIQANILVHYEGERMAKDLTIELKYSEVYDALNIGLTGKYKFTKAEISSAMTKYLSNKYLTVSGKGELPIPEIILKVIEECFTPVKAPGAKKDRYRDWDTWTSQQQVATDLVANKEYVETVLAQFEKMQELVPFDTWDPTGPAGPSGGGDGDWDPRRPDPKDDGSTAVTFVFKKELSNVDKVFYYKQENFADTNEIASVPIFLSTAPASVKTKTAVTPLLKQKFVVETSNAQMNAMAPGIMVGENEQYIIEGAFTFSAESNYGPKGKQWYRWQHGWPSVDGDLYYRIGEGPWTAVNGSAVIRTDSIYKGPLKFYLDRESIWSKIPKDFKDSKMIGMVPAIFTYQKTYPQYNVVVSGRRVEMVP